MAEVTVFVCPRCHKTNKNCECGRPRPLPSEPPALAAARAALAGLRAVERKMTKGEWSAFIGNGLYDIHLRGTPKRPIISWPGFDSSDYPDDNPANAEGIAALKNLAPALLRVLESALERNVLTPDELDVLAGIPKET